ncbi:MAG: glucose-6-phosphate isomerase [Arenimonas sp.]|nr:glucose-6-phosphate isomerase [Arenimonas sp.]
MWNEQDWHALDQHGQRCKSQTIQHLVNTELGRAEQFSMQVGPIYFNFSRQHYDGLAITDLLQRLNQSGIQAQMQAMFAGDKINSSEDRPVLHTALRSNLSNASEAQNAHQQACVALNQLESVIKTLKASGVTDIISVGIGGSDLGPRLVLNALADFASNDFNIHFLSSADGMYLDRFMAQLDPEKTAVLLVSKSFNTQETLINGAALKAWINDPARVYAITASHDKATAFDILSDHVLPIWDWVGGRFSVWSAVSFATILGIGMPCFREFLAGAAAMDEHFLNTPMANNVVAWQAITSVWNRNAMGYSNQAIIPYDERLEMLPNHLQQVIMESLGKSVGMNDEACQQATSPVLMGASGNPSQHSFFQYLQQGIGIVPIDFIGVIASGHCQEQNHHFILANLLAQAQSLANGQGSDNPQKQYPGNRPSTVILLDELTPYSLGMLMALYEHSVFVQSMIWGINAFDQWGVELGKQIANTLMPYVDRSATDVENLDPVTQQLLQKILI